jgi:DUF4097 and DUF4098 domain-containing protein YvlB
MAKIEGTFERTLNVSGPIKLRVETGSGDIRVSSGQDAHVFVLARFTIGAVSGEGARALAEKIKEDPPIEVNGNTITIGDLSRYENELGIFSRFFSSGIIMDFDVQVPYETEVELDSGSGDQEISGIRGPVSADAGSGDIEINGIEKEAVADTGSGDIQVIRAAKVDADAGSGDVTLRKISGDVQIDVGSGDIVLEEIAGGIEVDAGSGDIHIDSKMGSEAKWNLETASGDICLLLPEETCFALEAETSSGEIEVNFPLTVSGKLGRGELRGTVGQNPKAEIYIETSSGDVQIQKK